MCIRDRRRKAYLDDIAVLTGATVISEDLGYELKETTVDMLGSAGTVKVDKENTVIVNGAGKAEDIADRVAQIRRQIETTNSEFDREKTQERLAKLAGGVAVIKVGAATETELKERKLRIEDALNATKAAVQEGIVAGGGTALVNAIPAVKAYVVPPPATIPSCTAALVALSASSILSFLSFSSVSVAAPTRCV